MAEAAEVLPPVVLVAPTHVRLRVVIPAKRIWLMLPPHVQVDAKEHVSPPVRPVATAIANMAADELYR